MLADDVDYHNIFSESAFASVSLFCDIEPYLCDINGCQMSEVTDAFLDFSFSYRLDRCMAVVFASEFMECGGGEQSLVSLVVDYYSRRLANGAWPSNTPGGV
jgi:hypothetical protein